MNLIEPFIDIQIKAGKKGSCGYFTVTMSGITRGMKSETLEGLIKDIMLACDDNRPD